MDCEGNCFLHSLREFWFMNCCCHDVVDINVDLDWFRVQWDCEWKGCVGGFGGRCGRFGVWDQVGDGALKVGGDPRWVVRKSLSNVGYGFAAGTEFVGSGG